VKKTPGQEKAELACLKVRTGTKIKKRESRRGKLQTLSIKTTLHICGINVIFEREEENHERVNTQRMVYPGKFRPVRMISEKGEKGRRRSTTALKKKGNENKVDTGKSQS